MEATAASREMTVEELFEYFKGFIRNAADDTNGTASYTKYDNWSIPETADSGFNNRLLSGGYLLKNGNVLPDYWRDAKNVTAKSAKIKKAKAFDVKDAKGTVTFYKVSGNAKVSVSPEGIVTVKKGLKKAKKPYKVKVLVSAAGGKVGDAMYAPISKVVTLKVKVK